MKCLNGIFIILAVVIPEVLGQFSLKSGAANSINKHGASLVEGVNFPIRNEGNKQENSQHVQKTSFPTGQRSYSGTKPLVSKSSYPETYTGDMIKALAFMAEGNIVLEQDDNGTPNNPFDDLFVMINENDEGVNLSYEEIIMIRDVNHRLNSIFETTPGSITPAITTVVRGQGQGQGTSISASSRSMSFNVGQAATNTGSASGSVKIGYIPSRTIRRGNRHITIRKLTGKQFFNSRSIPFFNTRNAVAILNFQRQQLLRNQLLKLGSVYGRFNRFPILRPLIRPVFFRYF